MKPPRRGVALFQLLVLLAFLLILLGLLLPAVQKVREAAARMQSQNNLKQIGLAMHNHASANGDRLPAGVDATHFSAFVYLLPYIEQDNVFKKIDFTKNVDHDDNKPMREVLIKTFISPRDGVLRPDEKLGPTNYLLVAGSKAALEDNDGTFFRGKGLDIGKDFGDGTANTVVAVETLKGDGGDKAISVRRQHVKLAAKALKGIKDTAGVKDFEDGKNIAGTRGASWMDGRFLQATMNSRRNLDDKRPDVDCGGEGGLSGPRSGGAGVPALFADGSVRHLSPNIAHKTWIAVSTRSGDEVLPVDF